MCWKKTLLELVKTISAESTGHILIKLPPMMHSRTETRDVGVRFSIQRSKVTHKVTVEQNGENSS